MAQRTSNQDFKIAFRRINTLIHLLKISIEDFKTLSIHKDLPPSKNKRQPTLKMDSSDLYNALQAFLFKSKNRTTPAIWAKLNSDVKREQVMDIFLTLDLLVKLDDCAPVYEQLSRAIKEDNPNEDVLSIDDFKDDEVNGSGIIGD